MNARRRSLSGHLPPSTDPYAYFRIARGKILHGFENLPSLLARAWSNGRFELLSPGWEALGYREAELAGRRFCDLMELGPDAARSAMAALLTEGGALEFGLRRRDGGANLYGWHRQFDDFTDSIFVIGDELPAAHGVVPRFPAIDQRERQPVLDTA